MKTMQKKETSWKYLKLSVLLVVFSLPLPLQAQNTIVPQPPLLEKSAQRPKTDFAVLVKGGKLYRKNCARCHGPLAQGNPHWNKADANGKYPPPPLNGTGHTWHHPTSVLKQIIKDGTGKFGGNMPAWKGKLSDEEIDAILEWIKAQWPDNIYQAWAAREKQQQ